MTINMDAEVAAIFRASTAVSGRCNQGIYRRGATILYIYYSIQGDLKSFDEVLRQKKKISPTDQGRQASGGVGKGGDCPKDPAPGAIGE